MLLLKCSAWASRQDKERRTIGDRCLVLKVNGIRFRYVPRANTLNRIYWINQDDLVIVRAIADVLRGAQDGTVICWIQMKRPPNSWTSTAILILFINVVFADQQHQQFARPAVAYAPLFGERGVCTAYCRTSAVYHDNYTCFVTLECFYLSMRGCNSRRSMKTVRLPLQLTEQPACLTCRA